MDHIRETHFQELQQRKKEAKAELIHSIDYNQMDEDATFTGLYVQSDDIVHID